MLYNQPFKPYRSYSRRAPALDPMPCVIDPFGKNMPEELGDLTPDEYFNLALGYIPAFLAAPELEQTWHASACDHYSLMAGGPPVDMTKYVKLRGYVMYEDEEDGGPDLYPIAVFENPTTRHRAAVYPYAIICFFDDKGALLFASRFD